MEAVVLHRVWFLEYFCPKQGQDFKPSVAPIYPNMGKTGINHLLVYLSLQALCDNKEMFYVITGNLISKCCEVNDNCCDNYH